MNKSLDNKYFIILNKDEIIFSCLNNENKISFSKSHILINKQINLLEELENFLIKNLIEIEKSLKDFIKKIYIIIDTDDSLSVNLSIKYKLETKKINKSKINEFLSYLKYQFTKYSNSLKVIHMTVIKLLIDGKEKDLFFDGKTFNNLILEVKFECLKVEIVNFIKKIFSKYQISVEKILIANHLRNLNQNHVENIVHLAKKIIESENVSEVLFIKKQAVKKHIFERFFNFFG